MVPVKSWKYPVDRLGIGKEPVVLQPHLKTMTYLESHPPSLGTKGRAKLGVIITSGTSAAVSPCSFGYVNVRVWLSDQE